LFETRILVYEPFRIPDVQRLVQLLPGLWKRQSVLQLLTRTEGMRQSTRPSGFTDRRLRITRCLRM
jgi:hypothetical protein